MKNFLRKLIYKIVYKQKIRFRGKNNELICAKTAVLKRIRMDVCGNNNKIILEDNVHINNARIVIGFGDCEVENCIIKIGRNTNFNSLYLQIGEDNSSIIVGEGSSFSYNVEINCTDHHSIFDENNNLINVGKSVTIGDNVWVCKDVRIMKNSNIPNGCIVAQGSIVTKKFEKENCVIAGNPAKVVKENIHWAAIRPNNYLKKTSNC